MIRPQHNCSLCLKAVGLNRLFKFGRKVLQPINLRGTGFGDGSIGFFSSVGCPRKTEYHEDSICPDQD